MKEKRIYAHSGLTRKIIGVAYKVYRNAMAVELKSVEKLLPIHEAQLVNYLKTTRGADKKIN